MNLTGSLGAGIGQGTHGVSGAPPVRSGPRPGQAVRPQHLSVLCLPIDSIAYSGILTDTYHGRSERGDHD